MKSKALFAGLCWLLCGCVTTPDKPEPPLHLSSGMGAFAMDLTIDSEAIKNRYIYTVAQYDPSTRSVLMQNGDLQSAAHFSHNFHIREGGDELWVAQLPPGHYAITEIEAKLSAGAGGSEVAYAGNPLGLLVGGLAFLAIAEGSTDILSFRDEYGRLLPDAPVFRVEAGKVSYAGHLTVDVDPRKSTYPEYDNEGQWDGRSTITKVENRYMADYRYDAADLTKHQNRLNLAAYPVLQQPLSVFADRRFVLEDYPDVDQPPRSLPRAAGTRLAIIQTPAASPQPVPAVRASAPVKPVVPPDASLRSKTKAELQQLFLNGAISAAQYEAVRKAAN